MNYTNKATVENYLNKGIVAEYYLQLDEWIDAMSRYADTFCSQTLVADEATTRKYDGDGTIQLNIDDVYEISEVTVSGGVVTPYQYPTNRDRKNVLILDNDYFTTGRQNIAVTGKFGRFSTTVPTDLAFAVTVLVAGIMHQVETKADGIKSEKVGEYQVTYKDGQERADYDRAMSILKSYRPITF